MNNRNTKTRYEICSKLSIKTPERRQWHCSGDFLVNFEHIPHLVLVLLLLTLNMYLPAGFLVATRGQFTGGAKFQQGVSKKVDQV